MSTKLRAVLIALLGPALSALGALWVVANVLIDTGRELTIRYVVFDPGHLFIAAGILVSLVAIPAAFEVAAAEAEEVELDLVALRGSEKPQPTRRDERPVDEIPAVTWEGAKR